MAMKDMISVLLVEDDFATRLMLRKCLDGDSKVTVHAAASKLEAMSHIGQEIFDVVLIDLGLPDGSGIEVIRYLSNLAKVPKVLVLTALRDEKSVLDAIGSGADGYIVKDADPDIIRQSITELLNGYSPLSPSIARYILKEMRRGQEETEYEEKGSDFGLTRKELEVLEEIKKGATYRQIAAHLKVSESTIQTHIKNIYRKLGVNSRGSAVFKASQVSNP